MDFNKAPTIIGIRVLNDNVIWLWKKNRSLVVIDPSLSEPIIDYISKNNLELDAILRTS